MSVRVKRNLKQFREAYGITQLEMATMLGVNLHTLKDWERKGSINKVYAQLMSGFENDPWYALEKIYEIRKEQFDKLSYLLRVDVMQVIKMYMYERQDEYNYIPGTGKRCEGYVEEYRKEKEIRKEKRERLGKVYED